LRSLLSYFINTHISKTYPHFINSPTLQQHTHISTHISISNLHCIRLKTHFINIHTYHQITHLSATYTHLITYTHINNIHTFLQYTHISTHISIYNVQHIHKHHKIIITSQQHTHIKQRTYISTTHTCFNNIHTCSQTFSTYNLNAFRQHIHKHHKIIITSQQHTHIKQRTYISTTYTCFNNIHTFSHTFSTYNLNTFRQHTHTSQNYPPLINVHTLNNVRTC